MGWFRNIQNDRTTHVTGPLRQATGPLRSGAGVGVGMLRGAGVPLLDFSLDFKDSSRFHHRTSLFLTLGGANCFGPQKQQMTCKCLVSGSFQNCGNF